LTSAASGESGGASAFSLERYDASKAPRLYYPATVDGVRVGRDLVTGATVPAVLIGAFVPNTGDLNNGIVVATDPGSVRDFQAFARQTGNELLEQTSANDEFVHFLRRR